MTTYYKKGAGNLSAANGWNTLANGTGTDWTYEAGANVLNLNALAVTLDVDVNCTTIQASGAAGQLTVSGTRIITAAVSYSGTLTSGMVVVPTGTGLTINGSITATSSGYGVVTAGTGTLTISNAGGTAVSETSTGFAVHVAGSGALTVIGNVLLSGTGYGIVHASTSTASTITGNITGSNLSGNPLWMNGGTVTLNGLPSNSYSGTAVNAYAGHLIWVGSQTLGAGVSCYIQHGGSGGTVTLGTVSSAFSIAVSGVLLIAKIGGTTGGLTMTYGTATLQATTGQAVGLNCTLTVTGPTLPAANKVLTGEAQFGYAGSLLTPSYVGTGTLTPTLTVADNANGTATATIASGDANATNTVYTQKIDPNFATAAWVNSGNRTGNGTVTLTLANGCYFGQVRTDGEMISQAVYFGVSDGTDSLYQQILEAVQARILLLVLSGVADADVLIREWPKLQAEDVPATGTGIILCPTKVVSPPGDGTIDRDEVTYPVHLVFVSKTSPPLNGTNINPWTLHLQRTAKAFRSQRLSGVTGVYTCLVENFDVVNIPHWLNNRWVSGLFLKFKAREARGIT